MLIDCAKCGGKAPKLIIRDEVLGCSLCIEPQRSNATGVLHQIRVPRNKWGTGSPVVTHADAMNIKTNRKRSDGTYKPDPRWR